MACAAVVADVEAMIFCRRDGGGAGGGAQGKEIGGRLNERSNLLKF